MSFAPRAAQKATAAEVEHRDDGSAIVSSSADFLLDEAGSFSRVSTDREQRFAAFVSAHRDRAIGLAWRLVGDSATAEDVAQEAFARAFRGLDRFREEAQLSTWFHRILLNEAHRHLRWRSVRQRFAGDMPSEPPDPFAGPRGDPILRRRVRAALDRLPRGQREAFVLVHLEGMTVVDTAAVTGRAIGTIKSHLHRALRALRTELSDLDPRREAHRA
jgi:RNA polymerase sigma-70 factor (ECF subfamily)